VELLLDVFGYLSVIWSPDSKPFFEFVPCLGFMLLARSVKTLDQ